MAKFTLEQIQDHAEKVMELFADGFQWSDVLEVVPQVMEIVGAVEDMTGEEKKEAAEAILDYVIDETDFPWIPDSFVDPILKKGVRIIIPMLFKAAEGKFDFKGEKSSE